MTDFTQPGFYKTRDGRKAEVLAVRGSIIIGVSESYDSDEMSPEYWSLDGSYNEDAGQTSLDLIAPWTEPRKPREIWVNYRKPPLHGDLMLGWAYPSREAAVAYLQGVDTDMFNGAVLFREVLPEDGK